MSRIEKKALQKLKDEAAARSLERIKMMLNCAGIIYLREAHVWQGVANCAAHVPHLDEASNLCGK